jgi:hypothetical protein
MPPWFGRAVPCKRKARVMVSRGWGKLRSAKADAGLVSRPPEPPPTTILTELWALLSRASRD